MLEVTALSSNTAKACLRACRAIFLIASSPKFVAHSSTVDFNCIMRATINRQPVEDNQFPYRYFC